MKVLFVGIGSIGTRHLKNLHTVANERGLTLDVTALRSSSRELPAETARLLNRQISALDDTVYDLAFITNPTTLHHKALEDLKGKANFFFIEKPIFEDFVKDAFREHFGSSISVVAVLGFIIIAIFY